MDGRPTPRRGYSASHAYQALREMIVWGRLAPGTRLIESDIVTRLGVSRTPVRSALHRLQQEGYARKLHGREGGLIVAPLTQEDAREVFGVVGALEGLSAREAATMASAARRSLVSSMRQTNAEMGRAARASRRDPGRLFDLDARVHLLYIDAGSGPRIHALLDAIKPQAERYIRLYYSALVDEVAESVQEHEVIIDCIASGRVDDAQQAVQRNWRNAARRLADVISTIGERGNW
jgi:DNA-binding GntR family transcriptional regulator